jgi:hypothetical protein
MKETAIVYSGTLLQQKDQEKLRFIVKKTFA